MHILNMFINLIEKNAMLQSPERKNWMRWKSNTNLCHFYKVWHFTAKS